MESWLLPDEDDVPDEYLACRYPLDGYGALGQLLHDATCAGLARLRTARRRRREILLLRTAYELPAYDVTLRRP